MSRGRGRMMMSEKVTAQGNDVTVSEVVEQGKIMSRMRENYVAGDGVRKLALPDPR